MRHQEAAQFLALVLPVDGTNGGFVCMASDVPQGGSFSQHFVGRADHNALLVHADQQSRLGRHVWINAATLTAQKRTRETVACVRACWADADRVVPDDERDALARAGFTLIESGTPGHLHVWVPLIEDITPAAAMALNARLVLLLQADTSKAGPESLLRIPGVPNCKPGAGEVRLIHEGPRWTPVELGGYLTAAGIPENLPPAGESAARTKSTVVAAADMPDPLPAGVSEAVESVNSADWPRNSEGTGPQLHTATMRVVAACYDAGLTQGETVAVAESCTTRIAAHAAQRNTSAAVEVARAWEGCVKGAPEPAWITKGRRPTPLEHLYCKPRWWAIGHAAGLIDSDSADADALSTTKDATPRATASGWSHQRRDDGVPVQPASPSDPNTYFSKSGGLLAGVLAHDVAEIGPIAQGTDHLMWVYAGGVWAPAKDIVRDRAVRLLKDRYRRAHASAAEDMVRSFVGRITCEPVSSTINFRDGLLNWRTGTLSPHSPDVPSTVQLGIAWEPDATCPTFDRYLADAVPGDAHSLVWELIGYLLYSGNPLHKAVMLTGTGRNGKGTFLRVVTAMLRKCNVTAISLHDLVNTRFSTASLFGKIANIAGDIDPTYLESTATLKAITGEDLVSAEHKGQPRFDFTPWAVPVFSANKVPQSADTTVGYLSRWVVIPFPNSFVGREDRTLEKKIHAELAGIAARAVRALPTLLARGDFETPDSIRLAREDFERRVDQVRTWLDECAEMSPAHPWIARTQLYANYQGWAARDGHRAVKASEFYDRLEAAGAAPAKIHGNRGFTGVKMAAPVWMLPR